MNTFLGWLEKQGFVMNDDNCCMSKIIKGKQCTMCWHVNDDEVSHTEQKVLDEITSGMTDEWKRQKGRKRKYETQDMYFDEDNLYCI